MSTAAESAEWLREAIAAEVRRGDWEQAWVEDAPDHVQNVLDQNERLMSRGVGDLHDENDRLRAEQVRLMAELAKTNEMLNEAEREVAENHRDRYQQ